MFHQSRNAMKNLPYLALTLALVLFFSSCSGTKEITVHCSEKGRSDAQFFRASGSAKARDMAIAKDKALISTKQILASLIGSSMKSVTDNYLSQYGTNSGNSQKFETISREVVNQQIKNISISCEKTQKNKDGGYETFLSLEMPKSTMIQSLIDRVNSDPTLKSSFNEESFKKLAEEELKNK